MGLVKRVFTGPKATIALVRVGYSRTDEVKVVLPDGVKLAEGQHVFVVGLVRPGVSTRKGADGTDTKSASLFVKPDFIGLVPDLSRNREWGRNGPEAIENLAGKGEVMMARTPINGAVTLGLYKAEVTARGMYRRLEGDEWVIHIIAEEDGEIRFRPTEAAVELLKTAIPGDVLVVAGRPSVGLRGNTAQVYINGARVEYA